MSINGITNKSNEEMMSQINGLSDVKGQMKAGKMSGGGISGISHEEVGVEVTKDVLSERLMMKGLEASGLMKMKEGKILGEYAEKLVDAGIVSSEEEGKRLLRMATSGEEKFQSAAETQMQKSSDVYTAQSIVNSYKSVTDFDVRELMKLLIQAFAELMSTQRQADLNTLTGIVNTLAEKIDAMEDAKSAQFKSTFASAIGSIVAGSISVGMAAGSAFCSGMGLYQSNSQQGEFLAKPGNTVANMPSFIENAGKGWTIAGDALGQSSGGIGQILTGITQIVSAEYAADKAEAEIQQTVADATLEVWRKAQEQGQKTTDALLQFINNLLSMMQQLNQSISSTEKAVVQS